MFKNKTNYEECANCSINSGELLLCSKCCRVKYCSKACQIQHWREDHNIFCNNEVPKHNSDTKLIPESIDNCAICLEKIIFSELFTTECCHHFHKECILPVHLIKNFLLKVGAK